MKYTYSVKNDSGNPLISTVGIDSKPEILYKYYESNQRNISAFMSLNIYASAIHQLNDIFDSFYPLIPIKAQHFQQLQEFFYDEDLDIEKFQNDKNYRNEYKIKLYYFWLFRVGIVSLSNNPSSDLMWSHYTGNEGFAVGFKVEKLPNVFSNINPISYLENDEFFGYMNDDIVKSTYVLAHLKKEIWGYEDEYRAIITPYEAPTFLTTGKLSNEKSRFPKQSRLIPYPISAIEKVILGFNFFPGRPKNNILSFKNTEQLEKLKLIEFLLHHKIKVEHINIDSNSLTFNGRIVHLKKKGNLEFELEYE